jgi:acyl-CoA reductase-like NAD-dependent aldehyde dehydrogenase
MTSMLEMRPASLPLDAIAVAQRAWAAQPMRARVAVIARLRHRIASNARALAETIPTRLPGASHRTVADSLVAEVLPLLEACRFLEREAEGILRTRTLGSEGRPLWLGKVDAQVERAPWGTVLILAAANYPLLLAGVQTLQALAAGNAVLWKPAPGTEDPALALHRLLLECGLPAALLTVLDSGPNSGIEAASEAIAAGVDHVVLTGSATSGKAVARQLAETLTPATMELSGCDAVFLLPGADHDRALEAIVFGLRWNGSATCMAPRRLFLVGLSEQEATSFESRLRERLAALSPIPASPAIEAKLRALIEDARAQRAEIACDGLISAPAAHVSATLILRAQPSLQSMQADIFAPLLSAMRVTGEDEAAAAYAACPYALTASIFGPEQPAHAFAQRLRAGNLLINDLIAPTADPRLPFGGRSRSGYGVTRGAEGLLAMTTPRTLQTQRGNPRRIYEPTTAAHADLFVALAQLLHGSGPGQRFSALRRLIASARHLK